MYLVDTNVLVNAIRSGSLDQKLAVDAIASLLDQNMEVAIVPQNIAEFWGVCTRPQAVHGLGLSIDETKEEVEGLEDKLSLYLDNRALYTTWKRLVTCYSVKGAKVHDTRLVAAMLVHGFTHILTFNADDFKRFTEITAVHPRDIQQILIS